MEKRRKRRDGEEVEKVEPVKEEILVENKVVNAPVDAGVDGKGQEEPP